ncbi:hypothetical protein SAMN02745116_01400 [Pilibacter termitis]|uniref:Uncharacterized protein n=1 Tax=Pilibacter termitis TaxID=263852 RepID=A0A1T4NE57_9ENTE|nr:Phi-29-like late activator [Pilibacter termitis]SJZ77539.1 hypothetical protein SAMN02745116_01400 [Pilibacter termitis]
MHTQEEIENFKARAKRVEEWLEESGDFLKVFTRQFSINQSKVNEGMANIPSLESFMKVSIIHFHDCLRSRIAYSLWVEESMDYIGEVPNIYIMPFDEVKSTLTKLEKAKEQFDLFCDEIRHYVPNNAKDLQEQVRKIIHKKGYLLDSDFEGDYHNWIGVYARPKDKPTYLDPDSLEECVKQQKYAINGFKQDFAKWFEFTIEKGVVIDSRK